jgi:hypothetical protein
MMDKKSMIEQVILRMRGYDDKLKELKRLSESAHGSSDKAAAQALLKDLKAELANDVKEERTKGATGNEFERNYFYPAVREAKAHILVRWNSNPSTWMGDLTSAHIDITHLLGQLVGQAKRAK